MPDFSAPAVRRWQLEWIGIILVFWAAYVAIATELQSRDDPLWRVVNHGDVAKAKIVSVRQFVSVNTRIARYLPNVPAQELPRVGSSYIPAESILVQVEWRDYRGKTRFLKNVQLPPELLQNLKLKDRDALREETILIQYSIPVEDYETNENVYRTYEAALTQQGGLPFLPPCIPFEQCKLVIFETSNKTAHDLFRDVAWYERVAILWQRSAFGNLLITGIILFLAPSLVRWSRRSRAKFRDNSGPPGTGV